MHTGMHIPIPLAITAVNQLSKVDYNIATRLSHLAAVVVPWGLEHQVYWISDGAMWMLEHLDDFGSMLIALVAWLVTHSHP